MEFADLDFQDMQAKAGYQAVMFFSNGYGVSVVQTETSYGGREGLYEIAILKGTSREDAKLCYETGLTDDVIGWLDRDKVSAVLRQVENLK